MSKILIGAPADAEPGLYDYTEMMWVHQISDEPVELRGLAQQELEAGGHSIAEAQIIIRDDVRDVVFASDKDGTGMVQCLPIHIDDIAGLGERVVFHYQRARFPGFGTLVAVTPAG